MVLQLGSSCRQEELEFVLKHPPILSNETDLRQGTRVMGLVGSWRGPLLAGALPHTWAQGSSGKFHWEQWMQVLGLAK